MNSSDAGSEGTASSMASLSHAGRLDAAEEGLEEEVENGLDSDNRGLTDLVFSTICMLSSSHSYDRSWRMLVFKVAVEFLQMYRIMITVAFSILLSAACGVLNQPLTTATWNVPEQAASSLPALAIMNLRFARVLSIFQFRLLVVPKGYNVYITVLYVLVALVCGNISYAVVITVMLKRNRGSRFFARWLSWVQIFAKMMYTIWFPAILDYVFSLYSCAWTDAATGTGVHHLDFPDIRCLAFPHIAHMVVGTLMAFLFIAFTLLMSLGNCDLNPMTRNLLASSDIVATFKLLAMKICLVIISSALNGVGRLQVVSMLILAFITVHHQLWQVPYYLPSVNMVWTGLLGGILAMTCMLTYLEFTAWSTVVDPAKTESIILAILYCTLVPLPLATLFVWSRLRRPRRLIAYFWQVYSSKAAENDGIPGDNAVATATTFNLAELKAVYRFKDVKQVSLLCRGMRQWDEDGVPDPAAADFGEFMLKCGMARLSSHPTLLILYAQFLVEVRGDTQGALTKLQQAQKAKPSLLDRYNIHVVQQAAKALKKDDDTLDLLGYMEYQRIYRACIRAHKRALLFQRRFWACLTHKRVMFEELQSAMHSMERAQDSASHMYKRAMELYPGNSKLLKAYARFLEFVCNEPSTARRYYAEASRLGSSDNMLSLIKADKLAAAGAINEKTDGLIIINSQGEIMMVNAAALTMFGYIKGELEGKNVSVLMPAPISQMHNAFLQRYVKTGVPHILNYSRPMVALNKNRETFPVSLFVTQLAVEATEPVFLGVVRHLPSSSTATRKTIRFFASANGTILCADSSTGERLGIKASELVGQAFSSLCCEPQTVTRFIMEAGGHYDTEATLRLQMLHRFLPPVAVDLSITFGGAIDASSDYKILIIEACVSTDTCAVMTLDEAGRVLYASDKLADMLGYSPSSLVKMDLYGLLPQPYCQLHAAWLKDSNRKPSPGSCRAGGVVHLLAANGTKIPVTLHMSTRGMSADSVDMVHVLQVNKATDTDQLAQKRLLLSVNHNGIILNVDSGLPESLFGINSSDLVGKPLAAFIDIFGQWRLKYGEDSSLLSMLAFYALHDADHQGGISLETDSMGRAWRVGVHLPLQDDEEILEHARGVEINTEHHQSQTINDGTKQPGSLAGRILHAAHRKNQLHPACMVLHIPSMDTGELLERAADDMPVLQVSLYRSDALVSVVEVDQRMLITRFDESAPLISGLGRRELFRRPITKLLDLPASTTFADLMGAGAAVKSAMKSSGIVAVDAMNHSSAGGMGQSRQIITHHPGDGHPLHLEVQALSYDQGGSTHRLLRLQILNPSSASLAALIQLKEGGQAGLAIRQGVKRTGNSPEDEADCADEHLEAPHSQGSELLQGSDDRPDGANHLKPPAASTEHAAGTHAMYLPMDKLVQQHKASGVAGSTALGAKSQGRQQYLLDVPRITPRTPRWARRSSEAAGYVEGSLDSVSVDLDAVDESTVEDEAITGGKGLQANSVDGGADAIPVPHGPDVETGLVELPGNDAASGTASQSRASADAAGEDGRDEELAVDARRAKRLKRVTAMLNSSLAQQAQQQWRVRTILLLLVILAAHITGFAVVTTEVNKRQRNAEGVTNMARALDRMQAATLRTIFMQRCYIADFINTFSCNPDRLAMHVYKLRLNIELADRYHKQLYLGATKGHGVKTFEDKRLLDYWTFNMLPEMRFYPTLANDTNVFLNSSRSLWEMGNVFLSAARDVLHTGYSGDPTKMNLSTSWQYVNNNGQGSLFFGYAWSLDAFVDYVWNDLLELGVVLLVLLVVEALVVQFSCFAYELYLLSQCNVANGRFFSLFLALPSAAVRLMSQRQLQVDEDGAGKDYLEEDEDVPDIITTADTEVDIKKSVRMAAGLEGEDEGQTTGGGGASKKGSGKRAERRKRHQLADKQNGADFTGTSQQDARKQATLGGRLYKALLGWLDPKFKLNGKKLVANSRVVWKIMTPFVLWAIAVVVIFGVSYKQLHGLQGPLASLDVAAHVQYQLVRCRLAAAELAYSDSPATSLRSKAALLRELNLLQQEYQTLMIGGDMRLMANVSFTPVAPATIYSDAALSSLFFTTKDCLRADQSTCFTEDSPYYSITHSGLDPMIKQYIQQMKYFANLPPEQALANNTAYEWAIQVIAADGYDAMNTAIEMLAAYNVKRLDSVLQLHIILLAVSLVCMALFWLLLVRPYVQVLKRNTIVVAGMLSQVPAEVDVEGIVKSIILGNSAPPLASAQSSALFGTQSLAGPAVSVPQGGFGGVMVEQVARYASSSYLGDVNINAGGQGFYNQRGR